MDLSIIIPCHNLEEYITPLIMSLNKQVFDYDVEIFFILDDCTDSTKDIIERKISKNKYSINIIDCYVHSAGLARNIGIEKATGKYIWFIDGDDWIIDFSAIQNLLDIMYSHSLRILRFGYTSAFFRKKLDVMVWQYFFSKELIGETRFKEIQPHEDVEFMREISKKIDNKLVEVKMLVYYYNFGRPGSNMSQMKDKGFIEF
ncbi:MAG: glycosyltransferase family 2 protein [Bacillota bacterium]|nr:glycosyltransferase family 2 protein [Bacillota bacterium]